MEHTCVKRATNGVVVKLSESQTIRRQGIDIWSIDFTAVTPKIRPSHIVDENKYDVRATGVCCFDAGDGEGTYENDDDESSYNWFHVLHNVPVGSGGT
jgi:hypothetical protein